MKRTFFSILIFAFIFNPGITVFGGGGPKNKEVLITAFGPYGGRNENPATFVVQEMKTQVSDFKKVNFTFQLLRVSYNCVDSFIAAHSFEKYDLILMMGLYPESSIIRVETIGRNYCGIYKDVDSVARMGPIEQQAPTRLGVPENQLKGILKFIEKKKPPMAISHDAGDYVCNYLIYTMRYFIAKTDVNKPVLFVHVADTYKFPYVMKDSEQAMHILALIKHMLKKLK